MVAALLLAVGAMAGSMAMNPISGLMQPYATDAQQWSYSKHPSLEAPPMDLITAHRRGRVGAEPFDRAMKRWGYSEDRVEVLKASSEVYPDFSLLVNSYLTNRMDKVEFETSLRAIGYTASAIPRIEEWTMPYPSVQDFLTFIVREAFDKEAVAIQGMDDGFSDVYAEAGKHLKISEDVLKWYWRSHWVLPSPQMAFEFRHRLDPDVLAVLGSKYSDMGLNPSELEFKGEDLDRLLKYNDYMPSYRGRIEAITYQPLTRVDLRRIYALGLIDDMELEARLRELGYSRKDAQLMKEFYKEYTAGSDKDLSKSEILNIYEESIITREEALGLLEGLKYSPEEADYILSIRDSRIKRKEIKTDIEDISMRYTAGQITITEAETELNALGLSASSVKYYKGKIQKAKNRVIKQPSKSDLDRWVSLLYITPEEYKNRLESMGYASGDIQIYLKELGQ